MGFGYVATFLDDFNSPGNGRAHLDKVEESEGSTPRMRAAKLDG